MYTCSILSGWTGFAAPIRRSRWRFRRLGPCSILSGWTGFAATLLLANMSVAGHLQYPQRMDGLCSRTVNLQPCSRISRLQYPQRMDGLCSSPAGVAAQRTHPPLQYPQRMDGLCSSVAISSIWMPCPACSILSGWTGFAAVSSTLTNRSIIPLAVSSADGRALQLETVTHGLLHDYYLQYPQRMDELCSSDADHWTCKKTGPCSILSGWMSFAAYAVPEIDIL